MPAIKIKMLAKARSMTLRSRQTVTLYASDSYELEKWNTLLADAQRTPVKNLSDFDVVDELGSGGYGTVFKAEDRNTGDEMAVKVIHKKTLHQDVRVYRNALAERRILELVRGHPFVLGMHFAFQSAHKLYLVTELCHSDLYDFIDESLARGRVASESTARCLIAEMTLGLEHLHERGVLHRDLKPENILIDKNGHLCLADFGLAKQLQWNIEGRLVRARSRVGTPQYIAPDMIRHQSYDTSVDFWAMGAILYELLTGQRLIRSRNMRHIFFEITHLKKTAVPGLSPAGMSFLRRLLEKDPLKRLGSGIGGTTEIKNHEWLAGVDWEAIKERASDSGPLSDFILSKIRGSCTRRGYAQRPINRNQRGNRTRRQIYRDCLRDLHYVCTNLKRELDEDIQPVNCMFTNDDDSISNLVPLSSRPEAPMSRKSRHIIAGYRFSPRM
ncbi:Serine/threonine protein kinase Mitochondrial [Chondrus crispus]|uniref:non-specific serine/threonine protein kinase n=1 Tax=Chondrus crispus TaxID=2769 RepID=R7QEJ5_CHOCR|nr:Serine/threonine protein kinase Mitochondrial [Chondrus crispus]CDF36932.1 Serine/threonine protein kinase Mitochondrial [Chondrus crispus]|eukprot:XP_005716751.1 Serine/threonine protein kinase Mitochondrial [Chondrus crispus]